MPRSRYCFCVLCATLALAVVLMLLAAPPAALAQPPADKPVSFINDVAPILKENCFACHDSRKRSGKLDMTSYEKLRTGGSNDDPVTPGNPDDSELYTLLVKDGNRRMPPEKTGDKLPKAKADVIARWIKEGAKLDGGIEPKADLVKELRARWKPPVPPVAYKYPAIINAITFTPDNKNLVVGGHHELTVWSAADGKLLKRIATRAERAYGMAFLPDGKLLVAGGRPGQEGDVRAFDLSAPAVRTAEGVEFLDGVNDPKVMVKQLLDVDDAVLCLAVSPDGKRAAAGGCDRSVRVWDVSGGAAAAKLEQTVENHADWVLGVALAADNVHLLSASRDKTAKVWDLKAKESVLTFPEHQNTVFGVAASADGKLGYSVGADRNLRTWNTTGEVKQLRANGGHGGDVFRVVSVPGQPQLLTCSQDRTLKLWDANTGNATKTYSGLTDEVFAAAVSPDGTLVAGGAYDGSVGVWKLADAAVLKLFNASPGYAPPAPPMPPKK
jgi:WD40 repeat protein